MKKQILLLSLLILVSGSMFASNDMNDQVFWRKKKKDSKEQIVTKPEKKSETPFDKEVKGAKQYKGVFNAWVTEKGNLLMEVNNTNLEKLYLMASRVSETSRNSRILSGGMMQNFMFRLSADKKNVYFHSVSTAARVEKDDPITPAFKRAHVDPIIKTFNIKATKNDTLLIDVTNLFVSNDKLISPMPTPRPGQKPLEVMFDQQSSKLESVKCFERNMEISSLLNYLPMDPARTLALSAKMRRSIVLLPDEEMPMRYSDSRIGYFRSRYNLFDTNSDYIEKKEFIHRWRLEPKKEDIKNYEKGVLVEPITPIVFYVDTAFPAKWRVAIREGVEVWNTAFEAAGFKNAIMAKDYPNCPEFDPDDIRYSCFRYVASETPNAMGPSYVDPRTGEIIVADVLWFHNVISLLHNWAFVQTAAVDKRVRQDVFDADHINESIRYAAAHEVGHTLGLMHNMGASYAISVEQLRSPEFTQKYGLTPSIMDYARLNYVAQPGDVEKGVRLTPILPGIYDIYAINWGYRMFNGSKTIKDDEPHLKKIIEDKIGQPMYKYGAQQFSRNIDPSSLTEDIGSDHMKASDLGIKNLKLIISNLEEWLKKPNDNYDDIARMYNECTTQYFRYVSHVTPYVGGVYRNDVIQNGDKTPSQEFAKKAEQKRAINWLVNQGLTCDSWINNKDIINRLGITSSFTERVQGLVASHLFSPTVLASIYEGERSKQPGLYTLNGYVDDIVAAIFGKTQRGESLSRASQQMQEVAISSLEQVSGLKNLDALRGKAYTFGSVNVHEELEKYMEELTSGKNAYKCCQNVHHSKNLEAEDSSLFSAFNPKISPATSKSVSISTLNDLLKLYIEKRSTGNKSTQAFYEYQIIRLKKILE